MSMNKMIIEQSAGRCCLLEGGGGEGKEAEYEGPNITSPKCREELTTALEPRR